MTFTCNKIECPLFAGGKGRVPSEIKIDKKERLDFLFVGEAPSYEEVKAKSPFVGPSGTVLRPFVNTKFSSFRIGFSNVVRCQPNEGNSEKSKIQAAIPYCLPHLEYEIEKWNPKVVVLLGNTALQAFFPDKSFAEVRGTLWEDKGRKWFLTYHPSAILHNPTYAGTFITDLDQLLLLKDGKDHAPILSKIPPLNELKVEILDTVDKIRNFVQSVPDDFLFALDTEATSLNKRFNRILSLQISDGRKVWVIPLQYKHHIWVGEEYEQVLNILSTLWKKRGKGWIMHNAKFDVGVVRSLYKDPFLWGAPIYDTMLGMLLLDENRLRWGSSFSLSSLVKELLGIESEQWQSSKSKRQDLESLSKDDFYWYGAVDSFLTWWLFMVEKLHAALQRFAQKWQDLLQYLYSPTIQAYAEIQYNGVKVDLQKLYYLKSKEGPIVSTMDKIKEELYSKESVKKANTLLYNEESSFSLFGEAWVFDITKRQHLEILFFDVLGLQPINTTSTGKPQIDKNFYKEYQHVEEVAMVQRWYGLRKILTSYVDSFISLMQKDDHKDGRIRSDYSFLTVTGRTRSSNPNIQQIPRGDKEGAKDFKKVFVPEPGNVIVQLDYKANESRWWCILSADPAMSALFNEGFEALKKVMTEENPSPELIEKATLAGDIHRQTAARMWGIDIHEVTKVQRQQAKAINFGWMFGMSVQTLALQLSSQWDQENQTWEEFVEQVKKSASYFDIQFPQANAWFHEMEQQVEKYGYVETPLGRRRRLWHIWFGGRGDQAEARRQARNSPIQATASDATLIGVSLLHRYIIENSLPWKILITVHDSTVVEIPIEDVEKYLYTAWNIYTKGVMDYMTEKWGLKFPISLEVDFEIGMPPDYSWGNMEKWDQSKPGLKRILDRLSGLQESM